MLYSESFYMQEHAISIGILSSNMAMLSQYIIDSIDTTSM